MNPSDTNDEQCIRVLKELHQIAELTSKKKKSYAEDRLIGKGKNFS